MDPSFDKEEFIKFCKAEIIPNVLEAMVRGDLEVLQDWCFEAPFNVLADPIRQGLKAGYTFGSQILDVEHVDVASGQMMEQGPVLLITFQTQQIMVVYDKAGQVKEGDPVGVSYSPQQDGPSVKLESVGTFVVCQQAHANL